jgi:hypothetical protein
MTGSIMRDAPRPLERAADRPQKQEHSRADSGHNARLDLVQDGCDEANGRAIEITRKMA